MDLRIWIHPKVSWIRNTDKTLIFFFFRYPVDGERRTQHERLAVLRVHGQDPVAGQQARRLRAGRRGHGGRQEGNNKYIMHLF
jgi:hypothetical protein